MIRIEIDIKQEGDTLNITTRQLIQNIPTRQEFEAEASVYNLVMETIKKAQKIAEQNAEQRKEETGEKDEKNDQEKQEN